MFLSYVGVRVRDMERSVKFYREFLGLELVKMGDFSDRGGGRLALLRDPESGQRLELNCYPEGSEFDTPYQPGEGLDHLGVKVESVAETLREWASRGVEIVTIPESLARQELSSTFTMHIGFAKDPDGNWIGLYDHNRPVPPYDPGNY